MDAGGILADFDHTLVHDALASYDTLDKVAAHALCGAHLLREAESVREFLAAHPEWCGPAGWDWAQQVVDALMAVKREVDATGGCRPEVLARSRALIRSAGLIAARAGPPGPLGDKHRALARRIAARCDDYLRFATDPGVPFDKEWVSYCAS
jgi:hypothetical protein